MTYCVAVIVNDGIAFCSDSRTSAGVDQINTYSKMFRFGIEGNRQFVIMSAGNLATTQGVIARIEKDIAKLEPVNLYTVNDMHEAADYLGELSLAQQAKTGGGNAYTSTFIIGGQIQGHPPQIAMVYPEGNHITTSKDTPFLQIGESKYGKPILDRIIKPDTSLHTAALCALVSMDSTMRSNLTVGPPIDIQLYSSNSFVLGESYHLLEDSNYLKQLNRAWNDKLIEGFSTLPPLQNSAPAPTTNP
ncbi:MAG: peptidase [Gammaproteobacteria bacterium]|uniref:peptidase n=1 Tax=Pseudomaricurvus alcaniphilus TaxID=1166482 RepID=UPI00140BDC2C|nr:peptidase [Pseudomaricurvus alcaniphilus]MBR9909612.1 peptidase [Gammaproteobacteria bacterium]NHN36972.1 peptidase [Pseudomaricurvus alcaniphilus]